MSQQPAFQTPWTVRSESKVSPLHVRLPAAKPTSTEPEPPKYLRLHARRKWITGMLTPRPVLRTDRGGGSTETSLAVSDSLKLAITLPASIAVSPATENAFRRYRLSRFGGPLFSGVASLIGGLLVALGALWFKGDVGKGLLIAGAILTFAAALVLVGSAWWAPVDYWFRSRRAWHGRSKRWLAAGPAQTKHPHKSVAQPPITGCGTRM